MSPQELESWPHDIAHEFTVEEGKVPKVIYALYCKCQTACIGLAHNEEEIERTKIMHLEREGIIFR